MLRDSSSGGGAGGSADPAGGGAGTAGTSAGLSGTGGATGGALGSDAGGDRDGSSGKGGGLADGAASDGDGRGGASGTGGTDAGDASRADNGAGGSGGASGTGGAGGSAGSGTPDGAGGTAGAAGSGGAGGIDAGTGTDGSGPTDGAGGGGGADASDGPTACASLPLPAKATWIVTASHTSLGNSQESDPLYNPPSHAIDGNLNERWSTGKPQAGDEWLQIDFGQRVAIGQVTLQLGTSSTDYARGYAARVSDVPLDFAAPVLVSGAGQASVDTVIAFGPVAIGRYLLISQTGSATSWWSVAEANVACSD